LNWHHDDLTRPDQWWARFRKRARRNGPVNGPGRIVATICIVTALALALIDVARGRFGWWSAIDFWLSTEDLPLSDALRQAIAEKGYTAPTPVQAATFRPDASADAR
jgi:hypothetical protein